MADAPRGGPRTARGYTNPAGAWWQTLPDGETTPELAWPLSLDMYDRMVREEAQVRSVLRAVTLPLGRARWWVDPADARPEVVQQIADDLGLPVKGEELPARRRNKGRFSFSQHLREVLSALRYGHAFFEQEYRYDGRLRLGKLLWLPPKTLSKIKVARDGGLEGVRQHPLAGAKQDDLIPVQHLVAYVHEREGANWYGQSLLRPAYKDWLLKDQALRVQAQVIDRNGLGVPVYTASPAPETGTAEDRKNAVEEELDAGQELVKQYRAGDNAGASIPHDADLTLQGVNGKLPDIVTWIRYLDEQMARAVLAHFLNLGTETGSWALGSTFADFFTLGLQTIADWVRDIVNQHVVEDLVDLNYGEQEPVPVVEHEEIGSDSRLTAEGIKALVDARIITPDEPTEAYVRDRHGLPMSAAGDRRGDAHVARNITEMVQKAYLGVNKVLSVEETRELLNRAGAEIPPEPPFSALTQTTTLPEEAS